MLPNLKSFNDFLKRININYSSDRFYINNEYIYYLPENCLLSPAIHYIRTGLLMGRVRNDRFEPSQALAMNLSPEDWDNPLLLNLSDDRVMRYLKGETIEADDEYDGYRLLCVNNHSLGWIKQSGCKCKNKYYPGWRYN